MTSSLTTEITKKRKGGLRKAAKKPRLDGEFLSLEGAEALTGNAVCVSTLRSWIYNGYLKAFRPGKILLVRRADLLAFIESNVHASSKAIP